MSALTRAERETVVVWSEDVRINSSSPSQIARLRKDDRFREVPNRYADGLTVDFSIAVEDFSLTRGAKRRMSQEERERRGLSLFQSAT